MTNTPPPPTLAEQIELQTTRASITANPDTRAMEDAILASLEQLDAALEFNAADEGGYMAAIETRDATIASLTERLDKLAMENVTLTLRASHAQQYYSDVCASRDRILELESRLAAAEASKASIPLGTISDAMVHKMCHYLRAEEYDGANGAACAKCPNVVNTPYGDGEPGCYGIAFETLQMARSLMYEAALSPVPAASPARETE